MVRIIADNVYFREGFEYELSHAYNTKLIKNYLLYFRSGIAIPNPIMRQLPNFSDETLLSIRKAITDAGEKVNSQSKELSKITMQKINSIVKSDLEITDEDEKVLAEMIDDEVMN